MTRRQDGTSDTSSAAFEAEPGVRVDEEAERRRSDDVALCERLREQLESAQEIDMDRAEVVVSSGIVTLVGTVPEQAMRQRILQLCSRVQGVTEIHDQLLVAPHTGVHEAGGLRTEAPGAPG